MKATGGITKNLDWDVFFIRMVRFIKVIGKEIKRMGLAATLMQMAQSTKDTGSMMFVKVVESRSGQMAQNSKELSKMDSKKAKELSYGLTKMSMKETSRRTKLMAKVCTSGVMDANTKANGRRIRLADMENYHGQMEGSTLEIMMRTSSRVLDLSIGSSTYLNLSSTNLYC